MIRWFAKNNVAANLLMIGILAAGLIVAFTKIPLEVRPSQEFPTINISVPLRGGSPSEIEQQIVIPIEQSLRDLSGIDKIQSWSWLGSGYIRLDLKNGVDPKEKLQEVERRVGAVNSIPAEADTIRFSVPDTSHYSDVITVMVQANDENMNATDLTRHAFSVRDALISLPEINRANVLGTNSRQFAIQLKPEAMLTYKLTFDQINSAIRNNSKSTGAGSLKYDAGSIQIRPGKSALTGDDFGLIPIPIGNGNTIPLNEISEIQDGFDPDKVKRIAYNGKPALMVSIYQTREQSAVEIAQQVKQFVQNQNATNHPDITLYTWDDESYRISGRLNTLAISLVQGGFLVIIMLSLFLRPGLAFWVAIGIPVSFAGGILLMPILGVTGNMMSIFAFILVLGIVVDDAIVTAENVYEHRKTGYNGLQAAISGTKEVSIPVIFGVLTTMVAFLPLYNFEGHWGVLAAQIPPVVISVLFFSLVESKLILPCHLKHLSFNEGKQAWYNAVSDWFNGKLTLLITKVIQPVVVVCMRARYITLSVFLALGLACIGYWQSGRMGFHVQPSIDTNEIKATVKISDDSSIEENSEMVDRLYQAALQLQKEFRDGDGEDAPSIIESILTSSGGYPSRGFDVRVGRVHMELTPMEKRKHNRVKNSVLVNRMSELSGEFPNAESLEITAALKQKNATNDAEPIEINIRGSITPENEIILTKLKDLVRAQITSEELAWVNDNKSRTQYQLTIRLNEQGYREGLSEASLARQIKSSIIGTEIARIPRFTGEIRVFLKLPDGIRQDRFALDHLLVTLKNGTVVPLSTVADIELSTTPSTLKRLNGAQTTKIVAAPKRKDYDLVKFAKEAAPEIDKLFAQYPELNWQFTGYLEDYKEIQQRFRIGLSILLFAIFVLLAIPFNSMIQPLFVMLAIPFGIIGALLGHIIMDITPSYLSMFGVLALSGIVVNDSLVLIDTYNKLIAKGTKTFDALITAIRKRFRPILLTSLTTFVGLLPLMFAKSVQAKFLIPMAVSLGFGILFATFVIILLIPAIVLIANDLKQGLIRVFKR